MKSMTDTQPNRCFASTYSEARALFLTAAAQSNAEIISHRHPLTGPDGGALFLDEVRVGDAGARCVVFVASGTHGIEGFCGSGIQTFLLRSGLGRRLPDDVAVVFVHAVNPWGFAWWRRFNEDNIDLNRNFLDHTAPHPVNSDYDLLYDALNPAQIDPATVAAALEKVRNFEKESGWEALYRALSGGQYAHPRGVQYGGREPAWSNRLLHALWERHTRQAEVSAYIDLHSGLGPRAVGMLFQTAPEDAVAAQLARHCWPDVIRAAPAQGSDAALVSGLIGPAFVNAQAGAATGLVLEFGTVESMQVIAAVQADNWLHHHGDRDTDEGRAIRQRMREVFFLEDAAWQAAVCARAQEVIDAAVQRMPTFQGEAIPDRGRVRPARPDDAEILVAFDRAMARETEGRDLDLETLEAGTVALLAQPERGRVFVVELDGEVVATLSLTLEWSNWRNGYFWWIQSVYVSPAHRRAGHYRRLHEHVAALAARDPQVCGIRLYVEHENRTAQTTYRAMGMDETGYRIFEQETRKIR
jgi:ribosomal protein S18 acetylase RimI-like enzyme